jgi:hypothetical protein
MNIIVSVTGMAMHEIDTATKCHLPLIDTIIRFDKLKKLLKLGGIKFHPTPDSLFHSELPDEKYKSYYDSKTDSYIHVQRSMK